MSDNGRVYQFFSYLLYTIAKEMEREVANLPSLQLWRKPCNKRALNIYE